jgi:NhaP-type Na+/H+ or K+/H+ antiporter
MRYLPQRQGGTSCAGDDSRNNACAEVAVSAVVSIVLGLLGGIGLERLRSARKDFEARRDAYKALLALADRYELAMWEFSDATREEIAALDRGGIW